ncbi:hypothetical protein KPL71_012045 [Citrus sinensis]|uniref:Uncharacterized protein n=1 Tax=Citrus sinensis TaxID=2711 RepID=A0ACB8L802_CITSI|nr:hypothetical protein KPL71_012045 [Citrus sinensis]
MPLEWLTNYEHFHKNSEPVQTAEATFERRQNGQVKLSFQAPELKPISDSPRLSYTAMITAVQTGQEKNLLIRGFSSEGYPVYPDKINGHFLWDVPEAHMCNPDCPCLDDTDNQTLQQLDKKIDRVASQVSQTETKVDSLSNRLDQMNIHLQDRISKLDTDLRRMINNHIWGPEFNKKEAEIRKLKAEHQQLVYNQFFGFSHLQPTPQPKPHSPKKPKSKVKISEPQAKATSSSSIPHIPPEDLPQATLEPPKKDKGLMDQYHYHTVQPTSSDSSEPEPVYESNPSESNPSSSSSSTTSVDTSTDSKSEYADITSILTTTTTEDPSASTSTPIVEDIPSDNENRASQTDPVPPMPPPVHDHSTKSSSASWFTFDDIPHVESNFSEQSEQDDQTAFIIAESSDSEDILVISRVQNVNHISTIPIPSFKMSILPSKFHKHVPAIGFIDTGADTSMIDLSVLPSDYWEPHSKLFRAVNGETFETTLITKNLIGIQFFPNCIIWKKIVASKLPDKDLLIGFDILHLVKNLFLTSSGVRYKQMFLPYTDTLRLYTLSETPSPYSNISQKFLEFCPENHSQFHHPSPLWKNEHFFIYLPFKLNEDRNPTKASHPGMSPSDLLLVKQECSQLLQQGLIKPTDSYWACQAFYVEKRSELVRGKKRLVIDYQPLNSFLKDDKFPLPKIQTLFVHLQGAHIFSKFDLKAGFWQLGISPIDRHKTAFCIPDAHYQWTVLPFGLKVTPSLFQKAMTKIFSPILHHALVYIDDILLFSSNHESHQTLLLDFFHLVQAHGIMLSEKKSSIGKESIDFLSMVIKDGHYQPGPHIATELLKFPDTNFTKKQIQQFLRIVNYVRDFIPKVAIHTSQLSRMLKKQCPPWGPTQTEAVKQLKVIAQSPPPLRIPTSGQRILQTDASDDYWSAILLEEINGVRHFCAHASEQFKDSEKNYHVIYKEILAVKYGIKKFEFHLISHKFLINMDNSSFPRIFDFKNKLLPDKQLLSLKTWFAKYDFTVHHLKGKQNLIPDFLTRPAINKPSLISSIQTIPTKKPYCFPNLCMEHLFLTGLTLSTLSICEDELWYMWCLTTLYATKLVFPVKPVLTHLTNPEFSPDLLWSPRMEADMWTTVFIIHRPYFQHPETRDYWTQDMAYEWRTYPHPYTLILIPSSMIHRSPPFSNSTSWNLTIPQRILVMEQRPDYTNVLFQDTQDPWEDFQSFLHTENPNYTITNPDSPTASTSPHMTDADEAKYQQAEAYLNQRQIRRHKRQYEKATGDVSPSRYPSTP